MGPSCSPSGSSGSDAPLRTPAFGVREGLPGGLASHRRAEAERFCRRSHTQARKCRGRKRSTLRLHHAGFSSLMEQLEETTVRADFHAQLRPRSTPSAARRLVSPHRAR